MLISETGTFFGDYEPNSSPNSCTFSGDYEPSSSPNSCSWDNLSTSSENSSDFLEVSSGQTCTNLTPITTQIEPPKSSQKKTKSKSKKARKSGRTSACGPCYRAKLRCDRGRPCTRCVSTGKVHLCRERTAVEVETRKRSRAPKARQPVSSSEPGLPDEISNQTFFDTKRRKDHHSSFLRSELETELPSYETEMSASSPQFIESVVPPVRTPRMSFPSLLASNQITTYPTQRPPATRGVKLPSLSMRFDNVNSTIEVDANASFQNKFGYPLDQIVDIMDSQRNPLAFFER